MKITIYELLGLIKDGKAPKKIRYKSKEYTLIRKQGEILYQYEDYHAVLTLQDFNKLNDEVEIIKEEKEIEKLNPEECYFKDGTEFVYKLMYNKINEIIDEINSIKKEK